MSDSRVICKYPNRRLYDVEESRYITLEDIHRLVVKQIDFEVIDRRTEKDVTCVVLLQVVAELERRGNGMMRREEATNASSSGAPGAPRFDGRKAGPRGLFHEDDCLCVGFSLRTGGSCGSAGRRS